jgi:hypothetical protein
MMVMYTTFNFHGKTSSFSSTLSDGSLTQTHTPNLDLARARARDLKGRQGNLAEDSKISGAGRRKRIRLDEAS